MRYYVKHGVEYFQEEVLHTIGVSSDPEKAKTTGLASGVETVVGAGTSTTIGLATVGIGAGVGNTVGKAVGKLRDGWKTENTEDF